MPGRYLSDTTARCQTITQTRFFTTYVDSCWTVLGWPLWNPWVIRIGNATVTPAGIAIQAVLPDPSSMFYISRTAVPSAINHVSLLVESVTNPVVISVVETVDGQEVVLGEQLLQSAQMSTVSFSITPSTPSIRIRIRWFTAPAILRWRTICVQVPQMQSETYLVDVCDEVGDQYRFGFNGMHKDNEMQGIGNSLDYGFRIQDTRLGRFMSVDPLSAKFSYLSPYQFASNSPISAIDLEGLEAVVVMTGQIGNWQNASNKELGSYAMYKVNVFENMTVCEYNKAKGANALKTPDATLLLSRDAWNKPGRSGRSTKRYGSLNETPPGEYFLTYYKNGIGEKKYHISVSDHPGGDIINGPDGERTGIRWHQYDPSFAEGCSTTGSGKNKVPVFDIVDRIPSLKNGKEVKVIYEEREAIYDSKFKIWKGVKSPDPNTEERSNNWFEKNIKNNAIENFKNNGLNPDSDKKSKSGSFGKAIKTW